MSDNFENREDARKWRRNFELRFKTVVRPESSKTLNFNNTMSATDMLAIINNANKYIPAGEILNFQFADGNYTLDRSLTFDGFFGGGEMNILGNAADESLSTAKNVYLDFTNSSDGIQINNTKLQVNTKCLKTRVVTGAENYIAIQYFNTPYGEISCNYALGTATETGSGIKVLYGSVDIKNNYVSNINVGIYGENARIYSNNNDDTGTMPNYGLVTRYAGTIGTTGTQPSGATANESAPDGGVIR